MKIAQHGYKESTQKYYPMPMGELKICIIQSLTEKGREDIKIRINPHRPRGGLRVRGS